MSTNNKARDQTPTSPYQQLRKDRPVKIDIHPPSKSKKNVWIKPKSNAVQVPQEILDLLGADIEKRHVGGGQAEEIVFYQDARPFRESIMHSWAVPLVLMLLIVSIFACAGIYLYVPSYLLGTVLIPPLIVVGACALLIKRIRVDLYGCYALTKDRAIIIVPHTHLGVLQPMVLNFEFLLEKNLIMVHEHEARLQDKILDREPILADLIHTPRTTAIVSFYPRSKFALPFRFYDVQHSHAFELDFTSIMMNSPAPVNGGRLKIDKPSFEVQQQAARRYKIFPILSIVLLVFLGALTSVILWAIVHTENNKALVATVSLAGLFGWIFTVVTLYSPLSLRQQKFEAIANNRYVKYMVEK